MYAAIDLATETQYLVCHHVTAQPHSSHSGRDGNKSWPRGNATE